MLLLCHYYNQFDLLLITLGVLPPTKYPKLALPDALIKDFIEVNGPLTNADAVSFE